MRAAAASGGGPLRPSQRSTVTSLKAAGISVNVAIVAYLAWRLRERVRSSKADA